MDRRLWLRRIAALSLVAAGSALGVGRTERRIDIRLTRYMFDVEHIDARSGDTVTFVLTATDFVHGFSLPQLRVRADVSPGRPVQLEVKALPAGRYTFLCDNFCGEGHDRMSGTLVVTEF